MSVLVLLALIVSLQAVLGILQGDLALQIGFQSYLSMNLEETSSLTGIVTSSMSTKSLPECALWCSAFMKNKGLVYMKQNTNNCLVIQSGDLGEQTFLPQDGSIIFYVVQPPAPPVIYIHFEEDQGWTNHGVDFVMEETPFASASTIVQTHNWRSWLDLGNQSQACITIPHTCGIRGGTISAWVKLFSCHAFGGIISSMVYPQTSFSILCYNSKLAYAIDESDGHYIVFSGATTGWVHCVMIYHGVGQGITVYQDESKIGNDTSKGVSYTPTGNGQVVIGKRNGGQGNRYTSASVDEIKFYNRQLTQQEISNMYQ